MALNAAILPLFVAWYASKDGGVIWLASLITGLIFTIASVVRSYFFRRLFARLGENENLFTLMRRLGNKYK